MEYAERRWTSLLASAGLLATSGSIYLFPSYSSALAERLDLSNTDLAIVGAAATVGQWFGLPPGVVVDRLGPRRATLVGAFLGVTGFGLLGLAVELVGPRTLPWLAAYSFVLAQGSSITYVAGMKSALQLFHPADRGGFVGLLVCFFALSAGLFSLTYKAVFQPYVRRGEAHGHDDGGAALALFLYTVAASLLAVQSLCAFHLATPGTNHPVPLSDYGHRRRTSVLAVTVALAAWQLLAAAVMLGLVPGLPASAPLLAWSVLLALAFSLVPLRWAWRARFPLHDELSRRLPGASPLPEWWPHVESGASPTAASPPAPLPAEPASPVDVTPVAAEGLSVPEALRRGDFWLVLTCLMGGLTFGVTVVNNLSTLVASLWPNVEPRTTWPADSAEARRFERTVGALVGLFSSGNVAGRLAIAYAAEAAQRCVPRPAWFVAAVAGTVATNVALLLAPRLDTLFAVVPLAGASVGALFSVAPLSTADLFGLKHYAKLWGTIVIAPCASTILIAALLAGHVADAHAATDGGRFRIAGRAFCRGVGCYRTTFLATLAVLCATLVAALVLARRIWRRA